MNRALLCAALALVVASCGGENKTTAPAATAATAVKPDKLNLFFWSEYIPQEVLDDFSAKTGIKVNIDLYDSNEALEEKLQSGVADYDIVVPSDYMVRRLIQQNLLQPLDPSKLTNLRNLDPRFLNPDFDPANRHSMPYFWGTTGIGYNKAKVGEVDSWQALLDPKNKGRILMLDDMRESFAVALLSMGHSLNTTDPALVEKAAEVLKKQKALVKIYNSGDFANLLAAGDVDLAHGYNGQIAEVVQEEPDKLAYVVPKEGATFWMDSLCIPAKARNLEAAYAFLNYVMEPEVNAKIVNNMHYASANVPARQHIVPEILNDPAIYPSEATLARCEFIEDLGEATTLYDRLWTEIKAQ